MQWLFTLGFIVWLFAVVGFLALIYWRMSHYVRKMEETIGAGRVLASEAAKKSAETAAKLVEMLEKGFHV